MITRHADLYAKMSRHRSTTDPVLCVFAVWAICLLVLIGGLNGVPPPFDPVFVECDYPLLFLLAVQMTFFVTFARITARFASLRLAQHNHVAWRCVDTCVDCVAGHICHEPHKGRFRATLSPSAPCRPVQCFVWTGTIAQSLIWRIWDVVEFFALAKTVS